ncbi:dihydrodipicolinate synthase family protein, partial [Burkholderia contaminans]
MNARYQGVFPVVPTIFDAHGALDLDGQRRCLEFMIDAGSQGLCIHANYSEQFALGDDERDLITRVTLEHVAGRVPVIVTTSHFSARICAERNRRAQALGAAMVMVMPPYHGATFRVPEAQVRAFFREAADGLDIPLMIQDAPASGVALPAPFLASLAREIDAVSYFKIETAGAASNPRELSALCGCAPSGLGDSEPGLTLLAARTAAASVAMTGGAAAAGLLLPAVVAPHPRPHAIGG